MSAGNNNDNGNSSNTAEPTMRDLFNMLQNCPSKNDLETIKSQIVASNNETIARVDDIACRTNIIEDTQRQHIDKIQMLEINMELLKQEQLKNNICVSGIPPALVNKENSTSKLIIAIAKTLGIDIAASQFTSYAVANNKFVITHFYNMSHKQMLINKIRAKRSLMVEEVFQQAKSNSQIYLNDHLTPYFNRLYLTARNAKKEGKLASASSYGGKIRARKSEEDVPILITNENQLLALIDDDVSDMSYSSLQQSVNSSSGSIVPIVASTSIARHTASGDKTDKKSTRKTRSQNNTNARPYKNKNTDSTDNSSTQHRNRNNNNKARGKRTLDVSGSSDVGQQHTKVQKQNAKT